jgi:effector-binding domain-containing protein
MNYQCEIKDQVAQPTLSFRTHAAVGQLPQVLGQTFGAIMQYLGELGEQPVGAPFVAYYNMDMQNLDIEIGFPVSRPLPDRGELKCGALPAGKIATTLHLGPYDSIAPGGEVMAAMKLAIGRIVVHGG